MRFWSTRAATDPTAAEGKDALITGVDAALGIVAGQRWVPGQTAIALLESVRDIARDADAPEQLDELIDTAVEECDEDPIPAGPLTDALLDIRNGCRRSAVTSGL
jgi:hypothetical protein